jgi:predicted RNase H-like HicB family nuclease
MKRAGGTQMRAILFTVHIFREGDVFVAHVPELDVSSCGATLEDVRRNVHDAVRGFVETSDEMGTLPEILEEAGYRRVGEEWVPPELIASDRLSVGIG